MNNKIWVKKKKKANSKYVKNWNKTWILKLIIEYEFYRKSESKKIEEERNRCCCRTSAHLFVLSLGYCCVCFIALRWIFLERVWNSMCLCVSLCFLPKNNVLQEICVIQCKFFRICESVFLVFRPLKLSLSSSDLLPSYKSCDTLR